MRPFIFFIGNTGVPAFFFMVMVASLVATWVALKIAKNEGLSEIAILDLAIIAIIASVIGARLFHIFIEAPDYYWEKPIRVFYFWQGGFVSLGAFIATIGSWLVYMRVKRLDVARYLDVTANIAPVIIFFVRMGCLLNGCCYGRPTSRWPYIVFNNPSSTAARVGLGGEHLQPSQIYFMLNAIVMFFVLWLVHKHRRFAGQVGAAFLMYYGITRFFIEFTRGDEDRGIYFNGAISTGQIVMILFFISGAGMYYLCKRKGGRV